MGLDASDNIYVSSEGRGRIFFLTSSFIGQLNDQIARMDGFKKALKKLAKSKEI